MSDSILLAQEIHLTDLVGLVKQYHSFEGITMSDNQRAQALRPLLGTSPLGRIWLARYQERNVGYAILCFGYSIEFQGKDAFLDELFIAQEFRGKGIGRDLLAFVETEAGRLGVRALHLEVALSNTTARKFYSAKGFRAREQFCLMTRSLASEQH